MSAWPGSGAIVVPPGVLVSASHVVAVRLDRGAGVERVRAVCYVAGDADGHGVYDGGVPAFEIVVAAIARHLAVRTAAGLVETMELVDRLIAHQACRAAVEADVATTGAAPWSDAAVAFVDAYRRCWSDDLVRNLETLGTDGLADLLERLDEEIDTLGPSVREAAALRGLLNDWRDEWRDLGAPPPEAER